MQRGWLRVRRTGSGAEAKLLVDWHRKKRSGSVLNTSPEVMLLQLDLGGLDETDIRIGWVGTEMGLQPDAYVIFCIVRLKKKKCSASAALRKYVGYPHRQALT